MRDETFWAFKYAKNKYVSVTHCEHVCVLFVVVVVCVFVPVPNTLKGFCMIIFIRTCESLLILRSMIKKNPAFSHSFLKWSTTHHCKRFESICIPGQLRVTHLLWVLCCLLSREDWRKEEGWFIISLLKSLMPHHLVSAADGNNWNIRRWIWSCQVIQTNSS